MQPDDPTWVTLGAELLQEGLPAVVNDLLFGRPATAWTSAVSMLSDGPDEHIEEFLQVADAVHDLQFASNSFQTVAKAMTAPLAAVQHTELQAALKKLIQTPQLPAPSVFVHSVSIVLAVLQALGMTPDSTVAVGLHKLRHLLRVHPVLSLETLSPILESHPDVKLMLASSGSIPQESMQVLLCDYAAAVARVDLTAAVQLLFYLAAAVSQVTRKMSRHLLPALLDACRSAVSPHLTAFSAFKTGCRLAATLASAPGHGQALHALPAALEPQSAYTAQTGDALASVMLRTMLAICNATQCKASAEQMQALIATLQQPLSRDAMHATVTHQVRHLCTVNACWSKGVQLFWLVFGLSL